MIASLDDPDSFKPVRPSGPSKVNDTKIEVKLVNTVFKGDEAKVLSIILTEYSRNMSKLLMAGRIKQTPELEKELVTVATILERLAEADFSLRVDKEMLKPFGFTM
jgi:hypothetical protein